MKKFPLVLLGLALALTARANVVYFPGLWQSRFNAPSAYGFAVAGDASNNTVPVLASNLVAVTASDYLDRTPGLLMGYSAGIGPAPKQNPISGRSWGWYNYDVYAYEGEMFVEAGRTYQFYGRFDDGEAMVVDGRTVVYQGSTSGYSAGPAIATSYTAESTGWVPVNAWIWDWTSNKNVMNCRFALQYNPSGTPSTSYSDASVWKELADPGDMSLFRVAGTNSFTTLSSVTIASNETDFELEVSFDGLPAAAAVYACYGAFDGGMATSAWDHVAQVGTAAAGTSTENWTLPGAVGAKVLRLYVEGEAGVATFFTEWTERTALTANPIVSLDGFATSAAGVTASANLLSLGVGATSDDLLLDVATAEDGFDAPAFSFACADNPVTARGVHPIVAAGLATNTVYWFRAKATNELGGAGVSAVSSLALRPTAPAGTYAFASPSGTTLSGRATVSAFGDDSTWAKVRLEAASDAAFHSIIAASPEVSAEIGEPVPLEIVGLDYGTTYFVRLRIVNDWGLETFVVDDELRTTDEAAFSPLMVYSPGLIQAKFGSAMDRTTDILSHSSATNVPGAIMASTSGSAVNPYNGKTYSWANNTTFGYVGQMYMTGGTTYWFGKYIDDSGDVKVDGTVVMKNDTHNARATASCTPERTGWHDVEFRFGNGTGGAGCVDSTIGFGFNTNGLSSFTIDTFKEGGPWSKAVDPGDCSLLRTVYSSTPFFSVENVSASGTDLVATVTFSGIPEGTCDFTAFFGAVNGGLDPGHWASSALVTNPPAGDSASAQYVVPGAADAAFLSFQLTGTAGTNGVAIPYVQWGLSFKLAQESPSFGITLLDVAYTNATFVASCTGMGAGADSVEAGLQISTSRDFTENLRTVPLSLAAFGSQTLVVNGFATNTTYYVRVVGENGKGETGASSPVVLTTLDPQPPEGAASFSGRGFTSLSAMASVSTFGTGSASATIRFEASTNGFETVAAASTNFAATVGTGALIAVPGLAPDTAYSLRLRIENEWGLVTYVPIDGEFSTREVPLAATGIGYTVSDDRKTVDISFGVTEVFDGATLSAQLEYGSQSFDEQVFSQPGPIVWSGIPAAKGILTATVAVTSIVDGVVYAQTWTATIDLRYRAYAVSRLADLSGLVLNVGDTVALPEPTGPDDYYVPLDVRSFALKEDGRTLVALEPGFSSIALMEWDVAAGAAVRNATMGLAICAPECSGDVWVATDGGANWNWSDSARWRNASNPSGVGYPNGVGDVAIIPVPAERTVTVDTTATVGALYIGWDASAPAKGTVRLAGNGSTLTFRTGTKKPTPGLLRISGLNRSDVNSERPNFTLGSSGSESRLVLAIPDGLVLDGGKHPDVANTTLRNVHNRLNFRNGYGDMVVPAGRSLKLVNFDHAGWSDTQMWNCSTFIWGSGFHLAGQGSIIYETAALGYFDGALADFGGTLVIRQKQRYAAYGVDSRGGGFWLKANVGREAKNATFVIEGESPYNSYAKTIGLATWGSSHGSGCWGPGDNSLGGKALVMAGGTLLQRGNANATANWVNNGIYVNPNRSDALVVSNGYSCIVQTYENTKTPTNHLEFSSLRHEGRGTLRVATTDVNRTDGTQADTQSHLILHGFADYALGAGGATGSNRESIVPWIVCAAGSENRLYFPHLGMGGGEADCIVRALTHPTTKASLAAATDSGENVFVNEKAIALASDTTVNSLCLNKNWSQGTALGAGRKLTVTSGGVILEGERAAIGQETDYLAGSAGTLRLPNEGYLYSTVQSQASPNEVWASIVAPKGLAISFPGFFRLGGDQTGIDGEIAINGCDVTLGSATTGCRIDVPVRLESGAATLRIGKQGSFCLQDLHINDHGTTGAKFVPAAGTQERIYRLYIDGVSMHRGYYGSSESGVEELATAMYPAFVDDSHFSGTGWAKVMTDDIPATLMILR